VIRLALAAPSALLLAGLEALVTRAGAFTVVDRVPHLAQLPEALEGADVDVVVAVVDRPEPLLRADSLSGDAPAYRWLVLVDLELGDAAAWLRQGVHAILPRDADEREIIAAIEAVHAGLSVVPASMLAALATSMAPGGAALRSQLATGATSAASGTLSPREREILALLAEGMGNKIVAAQLGISEHTVKTHVASIFQKLGADTRAEAVAIGARSGLILL
jgi:DNA-binding NarL/FixJ family response regulator